MPINARVRKIVDKGHLTKKSALLRPINSPKNRQQLQYHNLITKAMRLSKIYVITCYAEIDLNGILTVVNLTEINRASETRKFRVNVTEILNGNPCQK